MIPAFVAMKRIVAARIPDVDLQPGEERPRDAEVLDHAEHRVVLEAALLRVEREERRLVAVDQVHRQRRERDERQREVDREDGDRDEPDRARDRPHGVARLLGEVRDGLDPRVGDHPHRDREEELAPGRCRAEVDVVDERRGAEDEEEAEQHEQQLRAEVDEREDDVQLRRLLDADDVEGDEHDDHRRAADDVPRVLLQRPPEDREVVGHEERRDGDRDDVVEHLRPRRPEGDDLVEGVAGEARGAARLGEADGALGVGGGGRGEEDAGDHEDERRQPEREDGGDAERVVDRGADVPVGGRKERVRTEDALELLLATPPAHRRDASSRSGQPASGYGTLARITCGSASSSRFT